MNRLLVVASALALITALTACDGDEGSEEPEVTNELVLRGGGGDTTFVPKAVTCGRSRFDRSARAVKTRGSSPAESYLYVEVLPVDEPTTYDVPAAKSSVLIAYDSEALVLSTGSDTPGSKGEIEVLEASCDPARLMLRVDATLGRMGNGEGKRMTGGIDLTEE